jgi:hypothetical protein
MFQRMVFPSLRRECSVREQFRVKWKQVIDEMERFRPEFVIFSAGFDAHDEDPLASCDLLEDDFKWATEVVLDACHRLSPNVQMPIMSILEGGYDIPALTASAVAHVQALIAGSPQRRKEQRKLLKKQAGGDQSTTQTPQSTPVAVASANKFDGEARANDLDESFISNIRNLLAECDTLHANATGTIDAQKAILEDWLDKAARADATATGDELAMPVEPMDESVGDLSARLTDLEIAEAVMDALGPEDEQQRTDHTEK